MAEIVIIDHFIMVHITLIQMKNSEFSTERSSIACLYITFYKSKLSVCKLNVRAQSISVEVEKGEFYIGIVLGKTSTYYCHIQLHDGAQKLFISGKNETLTP